MGKKSVVILFHILILILPFLWTASSSELFEYPKTMFIYAMTALIAATWATRMILEKKIVFQRTYLDVPLLLFLISQVISTLFSIDPHTSLWGYYSRFNGGLFSTISYLILYYAAVSNCTKQDAKNLLKTLVAAAIMTSIYSAPEHFGHSPSCYMITAKFDAKCWVQDVQTRVFGTFGQPNWQAAYLIAVIFIPLANILELRSKKKESSVSPLILNSLFLILFFVVLLFTKSRSGLLGFGLGFAIFSLLTFKKSFKTLLIVLCSLLIVFFAYGEGIFAQADRLTAPLRDTVISITKPKNPPLAIGHEPRASGGTQLEVGGTESGDIRKIVWTGAIKLFLKYPLFGSGVETYGYAYYNVRPVEHNLVSEWDFLYNKAHNEFLNFLATTGLFGLGSYLSIMVVYSIWTLKRSHNSYFLILTSLLAGFWALAVSNFFGFATVPVALLFFLYPALAWLLAQPEEVRSKNKESSKKYQKNLSNNSPLILNSLFLIPIPWLLLLLIWVRLGNMLKADSLFAQGKTYLDQGDVAHSYNLLKQAVSSISDEPTYTDQFSLAAAKGASTLENSNQATAAGQLAVQAQQASDQTLRLNRVHLNFYKTRIRVFIELAQINPVEYLPKAEAALKKAIELAPTDAKLYYNLGLLYQQIKQTEAAKEMLEKTITLKPNYESARQTIAEIYIQYNQPDKAREQYQYIIDHINPTNSVAKTYLERKL